MRFKPKACFDVDGTLADDFIVKPLLEAEQAAGFIGYDNVEQWRGLYRDFVTGKVPYEKGAHELLEIHANALQDKKEADLYNHAVEFFTANRQKYFRYFGERVFNLLRASCELIIVTAEPEYAARAVQKVFGADSHMGTEYEVIDGVFTGELGHSLAKNGGKQGRLAAHDVKFAFGDSLGDAGMLENAAHPVCISPRPELAQIAKQRGWFVNSGDEQDYSDLEHFIKNC